MQNNSVNKGIFYFLCPKTWVPIPIYWYVGYHFWVCSMLPLIAKILTDGIVSNTTKRLAGTKENIEASFLCAVSHIKSLFKKII